MTPTAGGDLVPLGYAGDAVYLQVIGGEGPRTISWKPATASLSVQLDAAQPVVAADGSTSGQGFGAYASDDSRCRTEIRPLPSEPGSGWQLCREPFAAFSPDGTHVLATDAGGTGLVVRAIADGAVELTVDAPRGTRGYGWESADAVLLTTIDGDDHTLVRRCLVSTGRCVTALTLDGTGSIPVPLPRYGS